MKTILKIWDFCAKFLCQHSSDKYVHFIIGLTVAFLVAYADVKIWHRETIIAFAIGFLTVFFIAPIKEICDIIRGGDFDLGDLFFSCLGGLFGAAMLYLAA